MALPSVEEIRAYMEGYNIDSSILSDSWINGRRDKKVIQYIQSVTSLSLLGQKQVTEFYSGNGSSTIMLNRSPIISLDSFLYVNSNSEGVNLGSIRVDSEQGILIAISNLEEGFNTPLFRRGKKNIRLTYTYGYNQNEIPLAIEEAITILTAVQCLGIVANRTGGGALSVQSHGRSYKGGSKWDGIRSEWKREARTLISPYISSVVGS